MVRVTGFFETKLKLSLLVNCILKERYFSQTHLLLRSMKKRWNLHNELVSKISVSFVTWSSKQYVRPMVTNGSRCPKLIASRRIRGSIWSASQHNKITVKYENIVDDGEHELCKETRSTWRSHDAYWLPRTGQLTKGGNSAFATLRFPSYSVADAPHRYVCVALVARSPTSFPKLIRSMIYRWSLFFSPFSSFEIFHLDKVRDLKFFKWKRYH